MSQPMIAAHRAAIWGAIAILLVLWLMLCLCGLAMLNRWGKSEMSDSTTVAVNTEQAPAAPKPEPPSVIHQAIGDPPPRSIQRSPTDRVITVSPAFASGVGIHISWQTAEDDGARVPEVLAVCEEQLKDQQDSPQASDKNARAMALVNQAIQVLNGLDPKPGDIR